jgi:hypothetical protein
METRSIAERQSPPRGRFQGADERSGPKVCCLKSGSGCSRAVRDCRRSPAVIEASFGYLTSAFDPSLTRSDRPDRPSLERATPKEQTSSSAGCGGRGRWSITDCRLNDDQRQNGGNPHDRPGCFETQHKHEESRKRMQAHIRPDSPVNSVRSCQLQGSVTVGILKFTRKFLTMVCLRMILMHTVGNGKEVVPRDEGF